MRCVTLRLKARAWRIAASSTAPIASSRISLTVVRDFVGAPSSRRAVTTLVISDLHLGSRLGRDVLRRPEALEALLAALDGVERLVLLGDVVELLEGRPREAMDVAEPVLRALGARLGSAAEVIVVPGNHDAGFVRPWLRARDGSLGLETPIPLDATPALARLTSWLEPACVRVSYPGVRLADRIWATHGHYLDRHLLPEAAYGFARGLLGRLPRDGATPADYEGGGRRRGGRGATDPMAAAPAGGAPGRAGRVAARGHDAWQPPGAMLGHHLAPLAQRALGAQMRRASIPALARVVAPARRRRRLGLARAPPGASGRRRPAPVERDRRRAADRQHRLLGLEPVLLWRGAAAPDWPGGAIRLAEGAEPEAIGLLDHLGATTLHP